MKPLPFLCFLTACVLSGCTGWPFLPSTGGSTLPPPTRTPRIQTPTPLVLSPTPVIVGPTTDTPTAVTPTETETPTLQPLTLTPTAAGAAVQLRILGCDTSIDILHGMGEVTNAYVTLSNRSGAEAQNVCATLRGLDEGRPHPDKTKCVTSLAAGYQVTLKLTVDTTYKADTPIQVDVTSNDNLLLRAGEPACNAIGVIADTSDLGTAVPIH